MEVSRVQWVEMQELRARCHDFCHFPPFYLPKSQVPTLVHSTMTCFPFSFLHGSYLIFSSLSFILSLHSVILDNKDNPVYLTYSETCILRSTKEELSTVVLPVPQTPL